MERKALSTCRLSAGVFGGWLLSLLALAPVPAAGQQLPIPELALWEAQMLSYGQPDCDYLTQPHTSDELLNHVYYDAERVFYQMADYTGNAAWTTCAQRAEAVYRDRYVLPNNGHVPGYWNFTHGLTMDYLRTGDVNSKNAVILLSQNAAYAVDGTDLAWTANPERSREVAYAIMSYINAERVGAPPRTRLPQLVDQALGHIDQWFISKTYRCPSDCDPPSAVGQYYIQPFMVGLTAEALIMEYEKTGDSRILPALKTALDWLWANAWVPGDQAFWYDNAVANPTVPWPSRPGAPDLNLLIAPAYAWLYRQTGDTKYRDRGDQIFAGGVQFAFLGGGKQFDQNYKWSFDYVKWRTGPADTSPPAVTITAPPASASVAGILGVAASATDNVGVVGVQFRLDGANLGAEVTVAPYTVSWNTTTALTGAHTLTATARDATGNTATSAPVTVTVINSDLTPPTVAITAPPSGTTVAGTITVTASATDNVGVVGVQFKLDGTNLGAEATVAPYRVSWNTTTALNGTHTLTAVARDGAGNSTASAGISVTVVNGDATPPVVSITSPLNGATVSSVVTISAMASDNVGVVGVQFKLDGANLGTEVSVPPYNVSWNTTTVPNATHTLTAVARDAAGNSTASAGVSVAVLNNTTPPELSAVTASSITSAGATITWTTNEASDTQVEYGPTTTYGSSTPVALSLVTAHSQTLGGLAPNTVYHYRVTSRDGAGNVAVSGDLTFPTLAVDLVVHRTLTPIAVDGVLNEWSGAGAAQFSGLSNNATVSLLWDATNLYVAFYVTDTQLRTLKRTRDASGLSADDTVEIYVDTLNDRATTMQPDDYQFLVNLNNVQGDLRGAGGWKDPTWNGIWTSAVSLQGTLNSNGHIDSGYIVEIAIPWAQIGVTPGSGLVLGMDFAVDDSDPASRVPFNTFDWAGITTGPYARPNLWKRIQLVDTVVTSP